MKSTRLREGLGIRRTPCWGVNVRYREIAGRKRKEKKWLNALFHIFGLLFGRSAARVRTSPSSAPTNSIKKSESRTRAKGFRHPGWFDRVGSEFEDDRLAKNGRGAVYCYLQSGQFVFGNWHHYPIDNGRVTFWWHSKNGSVCEMEIREAIVWKNENENIFPAL